MAQLRLAVVRSLAKGGETALTGAVTLSEGANVTLTQDGQDIEIAASVPAPGMSVDMIELSDADDPYTMSTPASEGIVNVKNNGSPTSIRVRPPSGHTIVDNDDGALDWPANERKLYPGWSIGYYYPGSGTVWYAVWHWFPTPWEMPGVGIGGIGGGSGHRRVPPDTYAHRSTATWCRGYLVVYGACVLPGARRRRAGAVGRTDRFRLLRGGMIWQPAASPREHTSPVGSARR